MSRALYKILVDDILRQIASGDIKVGERLPPEAEYAESIGVSRSTLRQAFSKLEQNGVIKRRKRGGTEVISKKPVQRFNLVNGGLYDVLRLSRDTLLIVTDISEICADSVSDLADLDTTGENWLACSGNRYMAGQREPFAEIKIYVPKHYSDIELQVGDSTASVLAKIEGRYGVTAGRVKREISAEVCDNNVAVKLGLLAGDAVLTIRTEIDDTSGKLLEISRSTVDPARFNVSTDAVVSN